VAGHHRKDQLPENGQEFSGVKGSAGGEEKALMGWMGADHPITVGGIRTPLGRSSVAYPDLCLVVVVVVRNDGKV
jgi:hypothetical protein